MRPLLTILYFAGLLAGLASQGCNSTSSDVADQPDFGGGPCTYAELAGTCTITEAGEHPRLSFSPDLDDEATRETFRWFIGASVGAGDVCAANNLEGSAFACTATVITKGTCTPYRFTFPDVCS